MHGVDGGQKVFLPCRGCGQRPVIELIEGGSVRAFCVACRADTKPVIVDSVVSLWNWRYGSGAANGVNS